MKNHILFVTIFLFSFGSDAQEESIPDTLYKVCLEYELMPEKARNIFPVCGYMNKSGEIIVPVGKYFGCMDDEFVWFAYVFLKEATDGIGTFVAVDRTGKILFDALWIYEAPDEISEGMVRITNKEGKIGYADFKGNVVIPPVYSWGNPFYEGKAKVTYNHRKVFTDPEHYHIESDEWITIDKTGKIVEK